jgi:hypothetical protein
VVTQSRAKDQDAVARLESRDILSGISKKAVVQSVTGAEYIRATRTAITKDCRLTCLGLLTSAVSALFEATRSRYLESGWNTEMSKSRENVLGPSARNWIG